MAAADEKADLVTSANFSKMNNVNLSTVSGWMTGAGKQMMSMQLDNVTFRGTRLTWVRGQLTYQADLRCRYTKNSTQMLMQADLSAVILPRGIFPWSLRTWNSHLNPSRPGRTS